MSKDRKLSNWTTSGTASYRIAIQKRIQVKDWIASSRIEIDQESLTNENTPRKVESFRIESVSESR